MPKGGKKKGGRYEPPKAEEPPPPVEQAEQDQEEESQGLGLGGSKRKQRKEKRQQLESARQTEMKPQSIRPSTSREQSEVQEVVTTPIEEKPVEVKIEQVEEEFEGLGLGGTKKKRPKKKKNDPIPSETAEPVQAAPTAQPATAAQPAPSAQPAQVIPGFAPAPVAPAPVAPAPVAPGPFTTPTAGPITLTQMQPSASFPPPAFSPHSAPGPWGRGRGRGQSFSRGPSATIPTSQSTPKIAQQAPPQPMQIARPVSGQPPQKPSIYSQDNIMCLYKIPSKVPGNTVGGKGLRVLTNYLEMTFKPLKIARYDVSFVPDRPKKMIPEVFKKVKEKYYPNELLAFDQTKNCYSLRPLANVPPNERFNTSIEIQDNNGRLMRFEVSFKATGIVDLENIKRYMRERGPSVLHPTEEVQCIDVILRQGTLESYVKAGRQFFRRPANPVDLGFGYEMWTGLFQSAIFTSKAFINIDVAHKGFPKHQPMVLALKRDFRLETDRTVESQPGLDSENFMNFIRGLKVVATLLGSSNTSGQKREYICNGLVDCPINQRFTLNDPDGKQRSITVGEYFAKEKKYRIKYPYLNCVWVGPREKSIYFPMELLDISYGQPLARQLNETQVSKMVKEAATPPDTRLKKIAEVISSMKYSTNQEFKQFGLEISDKFYEVNAKVLNPPVLDVGRDQTVLPRRGTWQANHLLKAENLLAWGFVAIETSPNIDYDNVIEILISTGKQMGMNISNPTFTRLNVASIKSFNGLLHAAVEAGVKFLFVVVSTKGRDHYHKIKQMAEREVGMLTQCVKEATTRRMNTMTAKNILLKVNSKLMGINQALGDRTMPRCLRGGGVMIVGADVTHPSPDQSNVPSIAAVTASIDPKCYMYNIELSVQTPKKEMIVEFEDMMFDHLRVYKERNMNQLPRKIFVFRDGVSEGQFVQVMNSELAAVHAAYARMAGGGKKPEILFLLVQKRHHTRFFNKGQSSQYNVEPGTVVDSDIVHSSELDFYLVSHQALKGTARPTRYHAVCNDGKIPDDEVEQLTYYLCHLYSRCMRSVSYPTPTYYAHLACLRARSLTYGQKFNNKELEKQPERLHVLDKMLQYSRMFFV